MPPDADARLERLEHAVETIRAMIESLSRLLERSGYERELKCQRHMATSDDYDRRLTALEAAATGRVKLWQALLIGCVPAVLVYALTAIAAHAAK